jgi:hypothetical protein
MRMKEKISIRINTVFEKKSPGIEVELYTKSKKKYTTISIVSYRIRRTKMSVRMGLDLTDRKKPKRQLKRQMNDSKEFHRQQMTLYSNWILAAVKLA